MNTIIEVQKLTHRYGEHLALKEFSFSVPDGQVVGLLGPNGAGKTTTVRLLNGLFSPTSGKMQVLGMDPVKQGTEIRRRAGVLTETPALYERLTAQQNLEFFGTLAGMPSEQLSRRISELLSFFELEPRKNDRTGTYSKGMKQRLALARALLHNPELLFLDEPTSGLDPEASAQVHELITSVRDRTGGTVLLATHNLFEAQRLCDRVVVMNRGRLLASGTLDELREQVLPGLWLEIRLLEPVNDELAQGLAGFAGVMQVNAAQPVTWNVQVEAENVIPQVVTHLVSARAQIVEMKQNRATLEEIYFKLQSREQEGAE
jgi:ABC-2 type transport system ATP-binding protein